MIDPHPDTDLESVVRTQHRTIRTLAGAAALGPAECRSSTFAALTFLLDVHETAERIVLDPVLLSTRVPRGDVACRAEQEVSIHRLLSDLRRTPPTSTLFLQLLIGLRQELEDHLEFEETVLLPTIRADCGERELRRLGEMFVVEELLVDPRGLLDSKW